MSSDSSISLLYFFFFCVCVFKGSVVLKEDVCPGTDLIRSAMILLDLIYYSFLFLSCVMLDVWYCQVYGVEVELRMFGKISSDLVSGHGDQEILGEFVLDLCEAGFVFFSLNHGILFLELKICFYVSSLGILGKKYYNSEILYLRCAFGCLWLYIYRT